MPPESSSPWNNLGAPPLAPPAPPARKSRLVLGCLLVAGILMILGIGGCIAAWGPFTEFAIVTSMTHHEKHIRASELTDSQKQELLDRMDRIRQKARKKPIGFLRFTGYDTTIQRIIDEGAIVKEFRTLQQEFKRLEEEFGLPEKSG